ncbi:MAG: flagellar basal-body rod protein FlgG [Deltaproteobacteria bacterium]|nr:MAG: flagellar basal-body rod protein FlgG [Deltaproteobacteria bacterium]
MMRSLWTAASGMVAMQRNIDVISNNLSNVKTTGFKKSRAEFEDLMYQNLRISGAQNLAGERLPTGIQIGLGVRAVDVHKMFMEGNLTNTGNQLDVAIEGDGFFKVEDANGQDAYTRVGSFKLNSNGDLVTSGGYRLQPGFTIPAETQNVVITEDGHLTALDQHGEPLLEGDIPLYTFINPAGLKAKGRNLCVPTPGSGDPVEGTPGVNNTGTLAQGFLESSNVDIVEEMVNMIVAQRAYETNSKAITTSDSMLQTANQMKR